MDCFIRLSSSIMTVPAIQGGAGEDVGCVGSLVECGRWGVDRQVVQYMAGRETLQVCARG